MHAAWWIDGLAVRGLLNLYLDAHSATKRAQHLNDAATWMSNFRRRVQQWEARDDAEYRIEWVFGGDRNFTSAPEHRQTSAPSGTWHPGTQTLQALENLQNAMGHGNVIDQPDFTWERIHRTGEGLQYWKEVLDVAGVSIEPLRYINFLPVSKRVQTIPHPRASDHWPVSIEFQHGKKQRWQSERGAPKLPYIPEWLVSEPGFGVELAQLLEEWRSERSPGLRGIVEFSSRLAHLAKVFLTTHWIEAKTASHKFDIAASLLARIQAGHGQVALATYPALGDIITAVLDTEEDEDSGGDILLEGERGPVASC